MLDKAKKKAMVSNWKERHPEMGVVSVTCKTTGEPFSAHYGEPSQQAPASPLESIRGSGF